MVPVIGSPRAFATADVDIKVGYPALRNHEAIADMVRDAAVDYVGEGQTVDLDYWFAGEDFAYFLQERPGTFYALGVRNQAKGMTHGLHTPQFALDEEALRLGPGFMAYVVWTYAQEATA